MRIISLFEVHGDGDTPSLYTQNEDSERGIAELRIISLVEAHGDGDALPFILKMQILERGIARLRIISLSRRMGTETPLPFIRNRRIPMGKIARLRINFPVEVHGDGDAPSLYTQNEDSERGNLKAAYNFPCRGT